MLVFTGPDVGATPVLGRVRGKAAIFNENVRALAARNGAIVPTCGRCGELSDPRMWAPDRLHLSAIGHNTVARMVLDTLGVENDLDPFDPEPMPRIPWRQARAEDLTWARTHFAPWVMRRLRGRSSGDHIQPKRPTFSADAQPRLAPKVAAAGQSNGSRAARPTRLK